MSEGNEDPWWEKCEYQGKGGKNTENEWVRGSQLFAQSVLKPAWV